MKKILFKIFGFMLISSCLSTVLADSCNSPKNDCFFKKVDCKNNNCKPDCQSLCKINKPKNANIKISDCCDFSKDSCSIDVNNCRTCCLTPVRTVVHFRSQGANTAREIVGWQWELNRPFMCEGYGAAYLAYEYQRSFRPERLANSLFGGTTLSFAGSLVADRTNNELLADNFGLSRTFRGSVTFCPRIQNHIVDLGYYVGLDCWCQGSYLRIHMPIVHTIWDLNACEDCSFSEDDNTFAPCYVSSEGGDVPAAQSLRQALSGNFLFGDLKMPWCAQKIGFCSRSKTALADIDFILGYNWLNNDCYHLGTYIQTVFPTGTKPDNRHVFEPIVGNRRHFELGLGISAHTVLWTCADQDLALFFEGNITHMFKNTQCRTFDLCPNGAFSRYLLLKAYDVTNSPMTDNPSGTIYNGNLISATCFNTRQVRVKVNVKGDASVKLSYRWCGWGADIGYNIYGHSKETIGSIGLACEQCCNVDKKTVAVKGTEPVCCITDSIRIRNNAAQPNATAFNGTPNVTTTECTDSVVIPPTRFVSRGDFNIQSAEAAGVLSHKVFFHFNYQCFDECGWNPHLGLGGEVEFDGNRTSDVTCKKAGLNQWGVWLKGGVSF